MVIVKKLHGEMLREALRQNLKKFRKEAHFSQEQIAQQLGVNRFMEEAFYGREPARRGGASGSCLLVSFFSRCAAYKVVRLCLTNRKPFVKRLLRPSGTLPNSRPSRQTRRAKTLR